MTSKKRIPNIDIKEAKLVLQKNTFSQIPKRTILLVNQTIAARLMQIAAGKGLSRLSKAIPILGGMVGGILDYQSCRETAEFAKELFQFHASIEALQDVEAT